MKNHHKFILIGVIVASALSFKYYKMWPMIKSNPNSLLAFLLNNQREEDLLNRGSRLFNHQQYSKAREYLEPLAKKGNEYACFIMCDILLNRLGVDKDVALGNFYKEKGLKKIEEKMQKGDTSAQLLYANILYNGKLVKKDLALAREHYKRLADQGDSSAALSYGFMLERGEGGNIDLKDAKAYYKQAADKGITNAQFRFAELCISDDPEIKDNILAKEYLRKAADRGHVSAQEELGSLFYAEKDFVQARKYFIKAIKQNSIIARIIYGTILYEGEGGFQDKETAKKYWREAADAGDETAKDLLSQCSKEETPDDKK